MEQRPVETSELVERIVRDARLLATEQRNVVRAELRRVAPRSAAALGVMTTGLWLTAAGVTTMLARPVVPRRRRRVRTRMARVSLLYCLAGATISGAAAVLLKRSIARAWSEPRRQLHEMGAAFTAAMSRSEPPRRA